MPCVCLCVCARTVCWLSWAILHSCRWRGQGEGGVAWWSAAHVAAHRMADCAGGLKDVLDERINDIPQSGEYSIFSPFWCSELQIVVLRTLYLVRSCIICDRLNPKHVFLCDSLLIKKGEREQRVGSLRWRTPTLWNRARKPESQLTVYTVRLHSLQFCSAGWSPKRGANGVSLHFERELTSSCHA